MSIDSKELLQNTILFGASFGSVLLPSYLKTKNTQGLHERNLGCYKYKIVGNGGLFKQSLVIRVLSSLPLPVTLRVVTTHEYR